MFMTLQCLINLAFFIVPEFDGLVCRASGNNLTVRVIWYIVDAASMTFHGMCEFTLLYVPNFDCTIFTRARHIRESWMDCDPRYSRLVTPAPPIPIIPKAELPPPPHRSQVPAYYCSFNSLFCFASSSTSFLSFATELHFLSNITFIWYGLEPPRAELPF